MSDNAKLKELAEALKRAIEQAEHKPGEWAGTAQSMGGICCPGVPFQIGKPWAKEEPWASFSYKRDSWLAVAAVNALPRLLGLIADNEWLTKAVGLQVIRRFVGDDDQKNIDELVAAGIQVDKELIVQLKAENERLAAACERAEQIIIVECKAASLAKVRANLLESNRDQLRAEVAGLKTGYEAYERVNAELKAENEHLTESRNEAREDRNKIGDRYDQLKAENETLVAAAKALRDEWRKDQADAKRHRFARDCAYGALTLMEGKRVFVELDYPEGEFSGCDQAYDTAIDAALGQGERS